MPAVCFRRSSSSLAPLVAALIAIILATLPAAAFGQNVYLLYDRSVPQAAYGADRLGRALTDLGYTIIDDRSGYDFLINIATNAVTIDSEAFAIIPEGRFITINGGDEAGMVYGSLALVEQLRDGARLENVEAVTERPHFPFRAIKHNLPWDTYRPSQALDQHYETARKIEYWEAFLDMMAENRFNVLSLWNLHPFTYIDRPEIGRASCRERVWTEASGVRIK